MVIAGVRGSQVKAAGALGVDQVLALDDAAALEKLGFVDAVADTVGGPTGEKLLGKVKPGGVFASVVGGPANAKLHPTIRVQSVVMHPDAAMLRILAEAVAAGRACDSDRPDGSAGRSRAGAGGGGKRRNWKDIAVSVALALSLPGFMVTIRTVTWVDAPVERCFRLATSVSFLLASAKSGNVKIVSGGKSGSLEQGDTVTWRGRMFGLGRIHTSHIEVVRPFHYLREVMVAGGVQAI